MNAAAKEINIIIMEMVKKVIMNIIMDQIVVMENITKNIIKTMMELKKRVVHMVRNIQVLAVKTSNCQDKLTKAIR